jgi:DNA-directed RNA polymerase specialized sigma24 family protein
VSVRFLETPSDVIRCLITYSDWWQPSTTSILQVGAARRGSEPADGFRAGLLETLDERTELCRRVARLTDADRHLLFLWYVKQLPAVEIARVCKVTRRQCFRRRAAVVRAIADFGKPEQHSA